MQITKTAIFPQQINKMIECAAGITKVEWREIEDTHHFCCGSSISFPKAMEKGETELGFAKVLLIWDLHSVGRVKPKQALGFLIWI